MNTFKHFQTFYKFQCPKTQCCSGFQQGCPCCPPLQHASFLLITAERYHMTWKNIFLLSSSFSGKGTSKHQDQAATEPVMSKLSFSFILFWYHTFLCGTYCRRYPFSYSNSNYQLSMLYKCHFLLHPAPTPVHTIQAPRPDAWERCMSKCICLRTTLWSSLPATDDYWCAYFSKLRIRSNHLEAPL